MCNASCTRTIYFIHKYRQPTRNGCPASKDALSHIPCECLCIKQLQLAASHTAAAAHAAAAASRITSARGAATAAACRSFLTLCHVIKKQTANTPVLAPRW